MPRIKAQRICLIRTSAIGDTVHALSLINGLRRGYPDAHLTWILQHLPHDMVKYQPNVDRFIPFDRKGDFASWRRFIQTLKKERFDLVLIPQVSIKVSVITFFIRAGVKLGFDFKRSREFHWLVTNRRIDARPAGHVQDQFFEFLDYLEVDRSPAEWNFVFTEEETAWQKSFFSDIGRPVIGFVIASSDPQKDWSPKSFAAVMDHVDKGLNLQPMIIGGPSRTERDIADAICSQCQSRPVVALEKPIRRTMLQLGGCRMVVAPDTGPLHIAVALDVPTIGLYGFSNPRRCGPYRKFHDLLIDTYTDPGEESAPITRRTKPGRMERITPEMVIQKIEQGLLTYPAKSMDKPDR